MLFNQFPHNGIYKAVFFDFGDTLAFNNQSFPRSLYRLLRSIGIAVSQERLQEVILAADYSEMQYERMKAYRQEDYIAVRIKYYRYVLQLLGYADAEDFYAKYLQNVIGNYHHSYLKPETMYVLETLRKEGYLIGIVSNFSHALPWICEDLQIADMVDFITYSDKVGFEKPSPQIFEAALKKAGVKPDAVIHVGDSYEADVMGARAMGITPVLVVTDEKDIHSDCICIYNLLELLELLDIKHKLSRP